MQKAEAYRQGDVVLVPIIDGACVGCGEAHTTPKKRQARDVVLALGEATGHRHRLVGGARAATAHLPQVVTVERPTVLTHEDHGEPRNPLTLERVEVVPQTYHVHIERSFDYASKMARPVMD